MTRKLQDKLNLMRAAFPRALSILLLAFIICGTTVEAAHNHGNLPGSNKVTSAAHFSDPATESTVHTSSLNCGDCLICQLHQNFSSTVLSVTPSIGPSADGFHTFTLTTVSIHSQTAATQRGRAPPFTL